MACESCPVGPGCRGEQHARACELQRIDPRMRDQLQIHAGIRFAPGPSGLVYDATSAGNQPGQHRPVLAGEPNQPSPRDGRPIRLSRELAVARYREDIRWVEDADADIFLSVYDKGHGDLGLSDRSKITRLPNQGREGRTWLSHILANYDDLADWTFFAQGEPHQQPAEYLRRLTLDYHDTTGLTREYLPHFPPRWIKDRDEVEWHDGIEIRYGRAIYQGGRTPEANDGWLRRIWPHFFACPIPDPISDWTYSYGAMYAVPRHRIEARPREYWEWCHDVIARPEHQTERSWGSGYAFELIWRYLFGVAERYPVRLPERDRARAGMAAELCRFGSGECGCGSVPRNCSHPIQPNLVFRSSDCLDCPFKRD